MSFRTKVILKNGVTITTVHRVSDMSIYLRDMEKEGRKRTAREEPLTIAAMMAIKDVRASNPDAKIESIKVDKLIAYSEV